MRSMQKRGRNIRMAGATATSCAEEAAYPILTRARRREKWNQSATNRCEGHMSIARMYDLAAEREQERTKPAADVAAEAAGAEVEAKKTVESALEKITAFIPTEIIGLYVAGLGIFTPQTAAGKWWVFFVCLALIPVFMVIGYFQKKKHKLPIPKLGVLLLLVAFAAVAFVAWAAAMPATPFLSLNSYATQIGGFIVVPLAFVMWGLADIFDALPKTQ
jgi:hypothetical protein